MANKTRSLTLTDMQSATATLAKIAATLGVSVDSLRVHAGDASYLNQCSDLMDMFARLPDEQTRETCLNLVRAFLNSIGAV